MTNNEIIINQAIAHGIYTKAEAQAIVAAKGCLPIHTFAEWKKAGYSVKRGEHAAITCDLWKYTERPGKAAKAARAEAAKAGQNGPDADAPDPHYYMAKAHLFTRDQVKPAGQDDAPKAKTPEEIAEEMKMPVERVREILKISQEPVSLETPIGEEEDSHLGDFIQDDNVPVPAEAAASTLLKEQLVEVLGTLTEREQKVLRLRFGMDDGRARTLEEVGKEFNVTRERIRQIEAKALRKLRHPSRSRKLKDYLD